MNSRRNARCSQTRARVPSEDAAAFGASASTGCHTRKNENRIVGTLGLEMVRSKKYLRDSLTTSRGEASNSTGITMTFAMFLPLERPSLAA